MTTQIIQELSNNKLTFSALLSGLTNEQYLWKANPESWCLLEIICHLYDEEREDFRFRCQHVLENPNQLPPPIDPEGWVKARDYINQDPAKMLHSFLEEREQSIAWLKALHSPQWDNEYQHPQLGPLSAHLFLSNWLAHDYLHIRQILKTKYAYLDQQTEEELSYAGKW